MRYILIILVLLSVGVKAQMVIKAHANYRPFAQPATNLLLDDYSGAAGAFSLRKLDKDYTGSAIRVRRSNDNTEQDIGFTASGDLDTSALKTFAGNNNVFVVTWYNQGDSTSFNLTMSVAANQGRIVNAGVVERINGKVAVFMDGNDSYTNENKIKYAFLHKTGESFCTFVVYPTTLTGTHFLIGTARNQSEVGMAMAFSTTSAAHSVWAGSFITVISNTSSANYIATNTQYLISYYTNVGASTASQRSTIEKNNGNSVNNNAQTGTASSSNSTRDFQFGQAANGGSWFIGYFQEAILWNLGQTSNKTGIQNNINDYYNIYWNGDFTGILDTYPNSAAAYSLRNLSSTYKGALIRVRKDTTGQPEMDIYGDYYGNLDTVGLKQFLLTRSGFISVWYDQSGQGRNASQATQANQPRIADLGVLERLNNKPTIRWVNGSNQFLRTGIISPSTLSQPITFFSVANLTASTGINASILFDNRTNTVDGAFNFASTGNSESPNNTYRLSAGSSFGNVAQNTNTNLFYGLFNTTSSAYSLNNGSDVTGNAGSNAFNGVTIGNIRAGLSGITAYDWSGNISELIFYNSNQSINKTNINNNINTYYSIY